MTEQKLKTQPFREMVLFPTDNQFNDKTDELMVDECYWTISRYPKNKDEHIGKNIFFYDKAYNKIILRATITEFGEVEVFDEYENISLGKKKSVTFKMEEGDWDYKLNLEKMGIEKRIQTRGWAYKWWS